MHIRRNAFFHLEHLGLESGESDDPVIQDGG